MGEIAHLYPSRTCTTNFLPRFVTLFIGVIPEPCALSSRGEQFHPHQNWPQRLSLFAAAFPITSNARQISLHNSENSACRADFFGFTTTSHGGKPFGQSSRTAS